MAQEGGADPDGLEEPPPLALLALALLAAQHLVDQVHLQVDGHVEVHVLELVHDQDLQGVPEDVCVRQVHPAVLHHQRQAVDLVDLGRVEKLVPELVGGEAVVVQDTHPALVQVLAHLRAPDVLDLHPEVGRGVPLVGRDDLDGDGLHAFASLEDDLTRIGLVFGLRTRRHRGGVHGEEFEGTAARVVADPDHIDGGHPLRLHNEEALRAKLDHRIRVVILDLQDRVRVVREQAHLLRVWLRATTSS
mmetsp:Transcript_14751/g.39115  ORF Transcript_14751/g.39115 Transcript_14751/m.39115 type:complete len:247 (+) Transcript_14751:2073-2813(+)